MKSNVLRAVSALALFAFAAPALPCGDKQTSASNEKGASTAQKQAVAKSDTAKKTPPKDKGKAAQSKPAAN